MVDSHDSPMNGQQDNSGIDPGAAVAGQPASDRPWLGRTVLIVGLGLSNSAAAAWCCRQGARVLVTDSRESPPGREQLAQSFPDLVWHQGFDGSLLAGVDTLCLSPGLSIHQGPAVALLQQAQAQGVTVLGEIELFALALAQLQQTRAYAPRVVAITGTNGKTTTTQMVATLVRRAGLTATAAGNIAPAALAALMTALDAERDEGTALPDVWVLELSSFQLETTHSLRLDAAVILNLTEDHLDWHPSFAQYGAAKARIFKHAAVAVWNRQDEALSEVVAQARAALAPTPVVNTGGGRRAKAPVSSANEAQPRWVSFGLDAPTQAGDWGLVEDGLAWLAYAQPSVVESTSRRRNAEQEALPAWTVQRLMPADALRVRGRHNAANGLAALALTTALGLPLAPLLHGLREYRGEAHRCEWIASVDGVDYIDDSKGTNVGATVAAILGLGQRMVLIAGGDGKGQSFAPLLGPVTANARAVVVIGRDGAKIAAAIAEAATAGVPIAAAPDLSAAVQLASELARPGDAVLLSPACASFDMFRDYLHRSEVFHAAVTELAQHKGVSL